MNIRKIAFGAAAATTLLFAAAAVAQQGVGGIGVNNGKIIIDQRKIGPETTFHMPNGTFTGNPNFGPITGNPTFGSGPQYTTADGGLGAAIQRQVQRELAASAREIDAGW